MKSPPFGVKNVISNNFKFYHSKLYNNHIHEFFFKKLTEIQNVKQILIQGR
jgi:hypothetical protein